MDKARAEYEQAKAEWEPHRKARVAEFKQERERGRDKDKGWERWRINEDEDPVRGRGVLHPPECAQAAPPQQFALFPPPLVGSVYRYGYPGVRDIPDIHLAGCLVATSVRRSLIELWRPCSQPPIFLGKGGIMRKLLSIVVVFASLVLAEPAQASDTEWTSGSGTVYTTHTSDAVGIGLSNPGRRLHVKGGHIKFERGSEYLEFLIDSPSNWVTFSTPTSHMDFDSAGRMTFDINSSADYFQFSTGATELMRIKGNGNVGIGNPSPDYKLDVSGTGRFTGDLRVDTTDNVLVVDTTNNRVGIGTNAPAYTLDVSGNGRFSGGVNAGSGVLANEGEFSDCVSAGSSSCYSTYELYVAGEQYVDYSVSALIYYDRTPYPESTEVAYNAVLSMERLPEGEYDPDDIGHQLNHSTLHPFLQGKHETIDENGDVEVELSRDLSATVSSQNEVIKDLIARVAALEAQLAGRPGAAPPN